MSFRLEPLPTLTPSVGPTCFDELLHAPNKTSKENKKYLLRIDK
jgi:hypothetical protein